MPVSGGFGYPARTPTMTANTLTIQRKKGLMPGSIFVTRVDHEAHVSAFRCPSQAYARFPRPHADPGRPRGDSRPSREGPSSPFRLKRFARERRLLTPQDFAGTLKRGRPLRGDWLDLHVADAGLPYARLGLIVPKRLGRRAVLRNAVRRQLREAFRLVEAPLPARDIVVRWSRLPTVAATLWPRLLREDVVRLFSRVA